MVELVQGYYEIIAVSSHEDNQKYSYPILDTTHSLVCSFKNNIQSSVYTPKNNKSTNSVYTSYRSCPSTYV